MAHWGADVNDLGRAKTTVGRLGPGRLDFATVRRQYGAWKRGQTPFPVGAAERFCRLPETGGRSCRNPQHSGHERDAMRVAARPVPVRLAESARLSGSVPPRTGLSHPA